MHAHILGAFFSNSFELVRKAVSDGIFSNLDSKSWGEVLSPQYAKDIDVPDAVPGRVSKEDQCRGTLELTTSLSTR
jgi:hypothetical protein